MALRALGVHGVWNYRPGLDAAQAAREISAEWAAALALVLGSDSLDVRVAYYAHLLRTSVPQGGGPDGLSDLPPDIEQMNRRLGR